MTKSKLYQRDRVRNREAYPTATKIYNRIYVQNKLGLWEPCLLTDNQIKGGIERAVKNPEDVWPMVPEKRHLSFWARFRFLFNPTILS
ncbi:MAG: hypothetical protein QM489_01205 [Candidatus Izemoplasma sp.]